ncbi:hypothetical protein J3458_009286 [Metarhizium acridum]|uniref:Uncharacterized protein n=1 Tax=Metarhizium acridum (strain CQMa 102) TaxID=655827 RepID=E9DT58_METAQ|nr:uncharacterized protein MAC_00940 [Metarhizium acridum CQMa 102]EFY93157.1 hypothetical protein MAC_00940 [Metarhizium acridum CQMa 102]KAG8415439.1 hypothetical protein J3458_009286 [Metarhizium acridum]
MDTPQPSEHQWRCQPPGTRTVTFDCKDAPARAKAEDRMRKQNYVDCTKGKRGSEVCDSYEKNPPSELMKSIYPPDEEEGKDDKGPTNPLFCHFYCCIYGGNDEEKEDGGGAEDCERIDYRKYVKGYWNATHVEHEKDNKGDKDHKDHKGNDDDDEDDDGIELA